MGLSHAVFVVTHLSHHRHAMSTLTQAHKDALHFTHAGTQGLEVGTTRIYLVNMKWQKHSEVAGL